jgi:hypothetical protein
LTTYDLIQALGGPVAVSEHLGVTAQAVCGWYDARAGIPSRHHLALWRMAQERGVAWRPPGAEGLRLVPERPHAA